MYDELVKRLRSESALPYSAIKDMREAANAIEELICEVADEHNRRVDAEERQRWIPVTERLPEEDTDVLVVRKFLGVKRQAQPSTYVEIASRFEDDWVAVSDEYKIAPSKHTNPTHWMSLPEPPKEGE